MPDKAPHSWQYTKGYEDGYEDGCKASADRELLTTAVQSVLFNNSNYPEAAQVPMLGRDIRPLTEKVVEAILAAKSAVPTPVADRETLGVLPSLEGLTAALRWLAEFEGVREDWYAEEAPRIMAILTAQGNTMPTKVDREVLSALDLTVTRGLIASRGWIGRDLASALVDEVESLRRDAAGHRARLDNDDRQSVERAAQAWAEIEYNATHADSHMPPEGFRAALAVAQGQGAKVVVCEWCPSPATGTAEHSDGLRYPACVKHGLLGTYRRGEPQ